MFESCPTITRRGTVSGLSLSKSLPLNPANSSQLRALSFFRERTGPSLGAFSKFTMQFFEQIIPLLSESEPAVRHMSVALATRQELLGCAPDKLYDLSAVRAEALSGAIKDLTYPTCELVSVLQCGLFFIGYECLQDPMDINPDTSVRHLGAGLRILEEYHAGKTTYPDSITEVIHNYLEPMYLQMEMPFSMFNTPIHTIRDCISTHVTTKRPRLPARFTDLQGARKAFFDIYRWHFHFRAESGLSWSTTSSVFRTVKALFIDWHALVMAYNDTLGDTPGDSVKKQNLTTLVSHWSLLMVGMVHSTASASASTGSPYLPNGGRFKTSVVDLSDPEEVVVTFIVDARSLSLLEICDWTDTGISGDPTLKIWPVAEVRRLEDGSGRGVVRLRMR